jgi:4-amino-4-deoxy-L-arabinose transferase-like glycosyltransferase
MRLLGILPFVMFIGVALALKQRGCTDSIRESLVVAGVNTAAWALAGAELLSLFQALAFWPLLIWWGVPVGILVWLCARRPPLSLPQPPRDPILLVASGLIGLLLVATLTSGLLAAPSNWDALSYHLPRQVYWMQQQHVSFFSTGDARMLTMPPLAEYIGVQLMILAGGDYWIHSIQWVAYALCAATVSLIARDLGMNPRGQTLAALLMVTIPPAALQATNAKNDLVTAFCVCALAFFGLQIVRREKLRLDLLWYLGATGGLLLLAKGTGMLFGLPIAIWIFVALLAKHGFRETLRVSAVAVAIAAILSGSFFARVYLSSDSFRSRGKGNYQLGHCNQIFTPRALLSNVLRNTAMHIATDSSRINPHLTSVVAGLHRWIGIDVNDPRTTFGPSPPYQTDLKLKDEDYAKAPVHILLGIAAFIMLVSRFFRRDSRHQWLTSLFLLLPYLAFFTFCFALSWQVWHSRLHVPVLCLLSPIAAFAIGQRFPRVLLTACALAAFLGFYAALFNATKPLIGKSSVITKASKRSKMQPSGGREAAKAVADVCRSLKPKVIGLGVRPDYCEYTLLRTLLKELDPDPQFLKLNLSWRKPGPRTTPDLVVTWQMKPEGILRLKLSNHSLILSTNSVQVYLPKRDIAENSP